ncbi:amino acid adenylation domain-containing protein [Paraburkholderia phenoliruptrix]|uniref:amino acid adenylation domain-containing protein n=1 Tax=Paraburkholderia phenoliruptrix TaxID=252970 RepID=UPI0034CD0CE2
MPLLSPVTSIEQSARRAGNKIAVRDGVRECTYAELLESADAVSSGLRKLGAGTGSFIGIALDRSVDWVVAMLGILKAGAAYIPLDPSYPTDRLEFCAQDSSALFVITNAAYRHISPGNALLLCDLVDSGHSPNTTAATGPHHPAYMLYTSGSTGRPKGVVVPIGAISYQMEWIVKQFAFRDDDIFLQKTSVAFDASVWEYLAPLMVGAEMVISGSDPDSIVEAVHARSVTVLQVVPTVLQAFSDVENLNRMRSLRALFCGGELLPRRLVAEIQQHLAIPIVNLYGPTEATVQCAFHVCTPGETYTDIHVPLGQPIPGTEFRVEREAEDDNPGELIIEGPCVADGYHNQPGLTAERFGVVRQTGRRYYKSGDLVEKDANGNFVFRGRRDNQVKLRGLRIELGDIEEGLKGACPHISDAIAVVNQADQIEVFVESDGVDWNEESTRQALASRLPSFMMPSTFTLLDQLPSLPNGKRDRGALKNYSALRSASVDRASRNTKDEVAGELPVDGAEGPVERKVRLAWSRLLPGPTSKDSHFFRTGGHSLLAMQLISALNKEFALRLSATALFARPTLGALTEMVLRAVSERQRSNVSAGFVKMNGPEGAPRIWFVHPAGGAIWCYREIANAISESIESFGIECVPLDGKNHYEADLKRMAQRYADTLIERQPEGPYVICGYSFGGNVAYEMCSYLESRGIDVSLLILLDTYISRVTDFEELDFISTYANKFTNGRNDAARKDELRNMDESTLKNYLLKLGIAGGHLPEDATATDVDKGLAMWIANNTAAATHSLEGRYDGATLFIRCSLNSRNSLDGWSAALGSFSVECVVADHFSVYKRPASNDVAAFIKDAVLRLKFEAENEAV